MRTQTLGGLAVLCLVGFAAVPLACGGGDGGGALSTSGDETGAGTPGATSGGQGGDGTTGSTSANSGSTATTGTGATTGSTSATTGGMGEGGGQAGSPCDPQPGDDECITCTKTQCCDELQACFADPACQACVDCLDAAQDQGEQFGCFTDGTCDFSNPFISCAQNSCPMCQ